MAIASEIHMLKSRDFSHNSALGTAALFLSPRTSWKSSSNIRIVDSRVDVLFTGLPRGTNLMR